MKSLLEPGPAVPPMTVSRQLQLAVTAIGAALVWLSAAVHLRLYAIGYDQIPVIGRLFLAQGIAGSALGLLVMASRHALACLAGAAYMTASIGGFLASLWFGLFGFHDTFAAPYAGVAIATEAAGAVLLLGAAALWVAGPHVRPVHRH